MRKIVVSQFLTLDGIMESPEKWNTTYLNDVALVDEILEDFAASETLLLDRTSYEFFANRWPVRTGEMADRFNTLPKYVVSTSLQKAAWNNSTIINSNAVEAIKKMKEQQGKNILVFGSRTLLQTLMHANLIDEYKLYIYPLTLGTGKRLFEEGALGLTFKLLTSKYFATGVVAITYQPTTISFFNNNPQTD